MDTKKFIKDLRKKRKQTVRRERTDLQNRQAEIRARKERLQERREDLRDELAAANEANKQDVINRLNEIKSDIDEINSEYKQNVEALECYSKVLKNDKEGNSSLLKVLVTGIGTGFAIKLGKDSLDMAYRADEEGLMVNKKCLDVFNKLNPLRMFQNLK